MIFPSQYSRRHHARLLGLDGPVIPDPIPFDRIVAADPEPKYVTFINPQPSKGMAVFARIAVVLNERRPDIALLVVEGRGTSDALARLPLDLSRPDQPAPDGQHARPARFLSGEPGGAGAVNLHSGEGRIDPPHSPSRASGIGGKGEGATPTSQTFMPQLYGLLSPVSFDQPLLKSHF